MRKNELKQSIDSITPDAYLKNRLKTKITAVKIPTKRSKQLALAFAAVCLTFALLFNVGLLSLPKAPDVGSESSDYLVWENKTVDAFLTVVSAKKVDGVASTDTLLTLNEQAPYEVYLKVKDIRGCSDAEKSKIEQELQADFTAFCTKKQFDIGRKEVCTKENVIMALYALNAFQFNLPNPQAVQQINVKNTSKYGQMVYDVKEPSFCTPRHGNDLTINGAEFDFEKGSFYWTHTEEMEQVLNENPSTSFSSFNDTITFTVEYKDGGKAVGVVDLIFDDAGNAVATCTKYHYAERPLVIESKS